jgi:hypothetical protein
MAGHERDPDLATFRTVFSSELDAIEKRRRFHVRQSGNGEDVRSNLVGLALSGGGIRSATFSLGVLQGFHKLGLLGIFDYLSTVSGGGFVGGWWSAWLSRDRFMASHIVDARGLAQKFLEEFRRGAFDPTQTAALDAAAQHRHGSTATAAGALKQALENVEKVPNLPREDTSRLECALLEELLSMLNTLLTPKKPRSAGAGTATAPLEPLFSRYEDYLTRIFPSQEKLESQRACDYEDPRIPDGALAAGADPVHHLRLFANYLTPRKGLLSPDTWRAVATVTRNLALTWLVLLPVLLAVVLAGQFYFVAQRFDRSAAEDFFRLPLDGQSTTIPSATEQARRAVDEMGKALGLRPIQDDTPTSSSGTDIIDAEVLWHRMKAALPLVVALSALLAWVTILWMRFNHAGSALTYYAGLACIVLLLIGADVIAWQVDSGLGIGAGATAMAKWIVGLGSDPTTQGSDAWTWPGTPLGDGWRTLWFGALVVLTVVAGAWITALVLYPPWVQKLRAWWRGLDVVPEDQPLSVRKQACGNYASRWHGRLLATWTGAVVVLAFAGFAHEALTALVQARWGQLAAGVTTASAVAGSIFTAFKASPAGGRDDREIASASLASRMVFAATPPLVLLVLTAAMAWCSHRVVANVMQNANGTLPVLMASVLLASWICLVYATHEAFDDQANERSRWQTWAFVIMGTGLVSWAVWSLAAKGSALSTLRSWHVPLTAAMSVTAVVSWLFALWVWRRSSRSARRALWLLLFSGAAPALLIVAIWFLADPVLDYSSAALGLMASLLLLLINVGWVVALGWMADPNALGLHSFYKARLIRAYLGASNPARRVSGSDINDAVRGDDRRLCEITSTQSGGPYHLINTTLNLVGGRDLTTAQRSAASFVLSPKYCGSVRTGYRSTTEYMGGKLTIGAAVAASGAAASPNMGSRTPTAALAMLLTLFNVRLGLWVPTPHQPHWATPQTRLWPFYLLKESLLQTNDLSSHCYLTDGGHFDNTGLYSLVERGCRYIVLIDNGADSEPCFEDLGEVIRRCRIDFGAKIDLNVQGFRRSSRHIVDEATNGHVAQITLADGRRARVHYVVGDIAYAQSHLDALSGVVAAHRPRERSDVTGTIVWIKPTLIGGESADVTQYGLQNPAFPQQTTADQWFDESQFESYRQLGEHSVTCLFESVAEKPGSSNPPALFQEIRKPSGPSAVPGWASMLTDFLRGLSGSGRSRGPTTS